MLLASPHYRGQVVGTAALASPEPMCSSSEPQWLFMPHLGPCRKCHRCSRQMPQSRLRRGLLDIPLRDVRLQHDRGHGADAVRHHTHQVGLLLGGCDELAGGCSGGGSRAGGTVGYLWELQGAKGPAQLLASAFLAACPHINDFGLSRDSVHQQILL